MSDAVELISRAKELYRREENPVTSLLIRTALAEATADPVGVEPPLLAEAWALRGHNLICDYLNRWNNAGKAELAQAEAAARSALQTDASLPYVHYACGFIHRAKGEHQASFDRFSETIRLKPDYARAYAQAANELTHLGKLNDALVAVREAIRIGSSDLSLGAFYWIMGRAQFYGNDDGEAVVSLGRSIKLKSNVWYNRLYLVSARMFVGDETAAATVLAEFDTLFPGYSVAQVVSNEEASPSEHSVFSSGRRKFHEGLIAAGMPAGAI
jgi:adenylate cyclase